MVQTDVVSGSIIYHLLTESNLIYSQKVTITSLSTIQLVSGQICMVLDASLFHNKKIYFVATKD